MYGRFERPDEPASDNARHRRTAAEPALLARTRGWSVHGAKIHAVRRRQVIEALRDAPRTRLGPPAGLCLTQAAHEGLRITLGSIELIVERLDIRELNIHG